MRMVPVYQKNIYVVCYIFEAFGLHLPGINETDI